MVDFRDEIKALLKEHGLKMKHVSVKARLGETFVRDMLERDREPGFTNLEKVRRAIAELAAEQQLDLARYPQDVPLRPTALGGLLSTGFAGTVIKTGAKAKIWRPPALIGTEGLYAFHVRGNSMAPEHRDGDLRFAIEGGETAPGDTVVINTRRYRTDPGQAYIKTLKSVAPDHIVASQHERAGRYAVEQSFPLAYVVSVDRVLTTGELFGA